MLGTHATCHTHATIILAVVNEYRCFNPDACPGGTNALTGQGDARSEDFKSSQCSTGYTGNLCAMCDVKGGYGTVKPFTCKPCLRPAATIALYSVAAC